MAQVSNRLQNLSNLRIANTDSSFSCMFGALSAGSIVIGFVKFLGGSDLWIGVLTAFSGSPSVFGLLQIPGSIWGRRFASFKRFVTPGATLWRAFYVPLVFLPLIHIDSTLRLWILIVCVSIATAGSLLVNPTYNEWIAELVPPHSRGWFFSRRNAILTIWGAVAGLVGGVIIDQFKAHGHEDIGFSVVFGVGSICSAISLYFYHRMDETPRPLVVKQSLGEAMGELAKPVVDRNYRAVLIFLATITFSTTFAGNFFTAFALESLHLPYTLLMLTGLTQALGTVAASPFCGYLADKYGNKPLLIMAGFLLTVTPAQWLFCYPNLNLHNTAVLIPLSILGGVVWAAVNLTQFNLVLATSPPEDRASYLGVALTVQNVVGFISPLLGALAMSYFRGSVADLAFAYKLLFGVTMAMRFFAMFTLLRVHEEGSIQVRTTLRDLSRITPKGLSAMRSLSRSGDVSEREDAIRRVAQSGISMAGDELVKALHDPSPRIRRRAAEGLARLGDPNAVEALIHQLEYHPDLIEEEMVDALGSLGGGEVVPWLSKLLTNDPRTTVRRAALRALGRTNDAAAIPPLIAAATTGDADMRRGSLRSLRNLGAENADSVFALSILDSRPSIRIAAAEGIAELTLCSCAENARKSLELFHDEASSEVAYALAAIGDDRDIPLILGTAQECFSMITRRRCLLGIARILGVEGDAYRILLLEGMGRDSALLNLTQPLAKRNPRLLVAMEKYSAGDEPAALENVARAMRQPVLQFMASKPVEELFIVVVCYLSTTAGRT
jgi:HEAT repeat protein/MFS family permease